MLESLNTNAFEYERLKPEEMQRRGILGRLVGIIGDTVNPTRNGRSYSARVWENVFENPIMKERIENNCCFGELGHPIDREETDMEKIAIVMDGMPKKDKDGKLQAVFNIIDTPNGRILKSLCDYGCNIGISSRGSGDLITDFDGNESVDPDTYNCEGWDAVIIPAVKEARLKYMNEALEKKRYNKSLRTKLQEAIDKETEDNKRIMTEALTSLGFVLNEGLATATPYMLRNDGALLKCGEMHPYIKNPDNGNDLKCLKDLFYGGFYEDSLNWYYHNTLQESTKDYIKSFLSSIVACDELPYTAEVVNDTVDFDYTSNRISKDILEIRSIYNFLNALTNQEFCRVRTSDMLYGGSSKDIYFRISSAGFDWFDLIYKTVLENKDYIDTVTICKDGASLGGANTFYEHKGKKFNKMPVEEFLTITGTPLIEELDFISQLNTDAIKLFKQGKNLTEVYENMHPRYALAYFEEFKTKYANRMFRESLNEGVFDKVDDTVDDTVEVEKPLDNFYKGIEIIEDPDSGKFVCKIDGESYSFNTEKNAKIWIDINVKDEEKDPSIDDYLKEEQVGRDTVKDDKNVDDVMKPETEEETSTEEDKKEEDKDKITVTVNESLDWTELSSTEQFAAESALEYLKNNPTNDLDRIELAVRDAVNMYNEANAFDEYSEEEFYEEEADENKVFNYVIEMLGLDEESNLTESLNTYPVEFTYDEETDDSKETFKGYINVKASSEEEALERAEEYVNSTEFLNKHNYVNQPRFFEIGNTKYKNVDTVEDIDVVDNIETEVDSLREMLEHNKNLEKQILDLQEKLSVSYTMEKKLNEELNEYKEKVKSLTQTAKDVKVLTEQLNSAKYSANKTAKQLKESKKNTNDKLKTITEKYNSVKKERDANIAELTTLKEDYDILSRDLTQTKEQYSKKFEKQNKLLEKYKVITKSAVDRYINMQATNLGVKPVEIKNRLNENFTFKDIDTVCEDLREYKLNVSRLPFNTHNSLNEGIDVKVNNMGNTLVPKNEVDELTDYDLKLMEAYL